MSYGANFSIQEMSAPDSCKERDEQNAAEINENDMFAESKSKNKRSAEGVRNTFEASN